MRAQFNCKLICGFGSVIAMWICALILATTLLAVGNAQAEISGQLNGFGTLSGGYLDDDEVNTANGTTYNGFDRGVNYDVDSKFALQGTLFFNKSLSFTAQAVALAENDYDPEIEWNYLSWLVNNQLKIRAGRLRRPNYLYSDTIRVGYTYPWVRPPVEVYSRDLQFFSEVDAINMLANWSSNEWHYELEAYYGESSAKADFTSDEEIKISTRDDIGLILTMERDWLSLRFGYQQLPHANIGMAASVQSLFDALTTAGFPEIVNDLDTNDIKAEYFNLAASIDYHDWLFIAEYIDVPIDGSIAPDETSWYLTAGRRLGAWTLHYTYAERKRNNRADFTSPLVAQANLVAPVNPFIAGTLNGLASGVEQAQSQLDFDLHSQTIGLRYDFESSIALKAEVEQIHDKRNNLDSELFSVSVDFFF